MLALFAGVAALLWVLERIITKPSRAAYPCVRVAAPLATSTIAYLLNVGVVTAFWRKALQFARRSRFWLAGMAISAGAVVALLGATYSAARVMAENVGSFTPTDAANAPIGVARGIKPGRVSWAYDQTATNFAGTGSYADDTNTDKVKVRAMLERAICVLTDQSAIASAWSSLFTYFNGKQGNGAMAYAKGEKIAIKINLNNNGSGTMIDATPQSVHALLWELVNVVGAAQTDIYVYDTMRRSGMARVKSACQKDFPNVHYNDGSTVAAITFSGGGITTKNVGTEVANAKYLVNMALLKRHGKPDPNWVESYGNTGVTLTFKNHCGTVDNCRSLHTELRDWNQNFGSYNPLVDLAASKKVGQKTVLYLLDALYTGNLWNSSPQKWALAPFSGDYPSSLFASQDPVAVDSVGLDFLRAEWPLLSNADNYLHEAALISSPPSATVYKPDGTAVTESLGVHEHWNNSSSKQYTRNLDPINGKGIELVRAENYVYGSGGSTNGTGGVNATGGTSAAGGAATSGGTRAAGGVSATNGGASLVGGAGTASTASQTASGGLTSAGNSTASSVATRGTAVTMGGSAIASSSSVEGDPAGDAEGCSCRTTQRLPRHLAAFLAFLALAGVLRRRRCAS
jgi:hypothetical protein